MKILSINPVQGINKRERIKHSAPNNSGNFIISQENDFHNLSKISFKNNCLSKRELLARILKMGVRDVSPEKFDRAVDYFAISSGYSSELLNRFELIAQKLDKNNIERKGIMSALLTEFFPNIEEFDRHLDEMLKRDITPSCISNIIEFSKNNTNVLNEINYETVDKLIHCRDLAMENIEKLEHRGMKLSTEDIDNLCFELPQMTINMYDLIGEKAFVYAFKDKIDNFIDYLVALGRALDDKNLMRDLKLLTNPVATEEYQFLLEEIAASKKEYKMCADIEDIRCVEYRIADLTRKKNDILENSIKDPKQILEVALIVTALYSHGSEVQDVLNLSNPRTQSEKARYNKVLNEKIYSLFDIDVRSDEVAGKLDFSECKYLPRIYSASGEFKRQFGKLIKLLENNLHKSNYEIFNELPQNKLTQEEFKKRAIDYEKWCLFNEDSYLELKDKDGDLNGIKIRKANLNDIPHAIFMGQDADCCTKVGGRFDFATIGYIKNKMFSAIEILDDGVCVGNTICYFAEVDGELSLILDNVSFKPRYRENEIITKGVYEYAKQLCEEVGRKGIPIYLSGERNQTYPIKQKPEIKNLNIIGSDGDDFSYLDFLYKTINISAENNQSLCSQLLKIN